MTVKRVSRIQSELASGEAFLVTGKSNRFYYTGFHSSAGMVFICPDASVFLIDFRYVEKAKSVVKSCDVQLSQRAFSEVKELCYKYGIKTLYTEADVMSLSQYRSLSATLEGITVSDSDKFDRITEDMRVIKTAEELALMKRAQDITDKTFSYACEIIAAGKTEREVMLDMEMYMRRMDCEGIGFDFIVVSGKNSSLPHGVPTDKKIECGDFVTMDFGACVDGYRSDMTRTVAVDHVTDEMKFVYDTVLRAQLESLKAIRAGLVCRDIDKIARDIINEAGFEGCFGHGLGHSVGIDIHESPALNTRCTELLRPGTIMTVEPGIYLENKFGVRIEDMVYITEDGCENLTGSDKSLIIL